MSNDVKEKVLKNQRTSPIEISDLPNELLCQIFSNLSVKNILSVIIDVCTRWRYIIELNVVFWKALRVVIDCDNFLNTSLLDPASYLDKCLKLEEQEEIYIGEHDLNRVFLVQSIKLKNGYKAISRPDLLVIRIIDIMSKTCKDIEIVECSHCIGSSSFYMLRFLNEKYENINEIKFDVSCTYKIPYEEITKYNNLSTLISHDYRFKRSDLYCLVDGCLKLSSLWIIFARYIKNEDVIYLLEKKKNSLKELGMGLAVSDVVLNKIKECTQLNVLFFSDARYITNVGISSLNNLTTLQYISLHRAKIKPTAIISWISSSSLAQKRIVLDLTNYKFKDSSWICQMPKGCLVTFNNDINKAIDKYHKPYGSRTHWMYSSLS